MTQMHALPDSRDTLARPSVHLVSGDLLGWLHEKLAAAEKSLDARRQGAECWRGGTAKEWKAVGNKMTKAQRIAQAEVETRIAAKYQREVDNFRAVIAALPNPEVSQMHTLPRYRPTKNGQVCILALTIC
jgi:hypothetical protein